MALVVALGSVSLWAITAEEVKDASKKTPAQVAFERLVKLEGSWKGTATHGGEEASETEVAYHVTAAGSAVVETLFVGAPHEMVTVYHLDGENLILTHYCALANQPTMKLEKSSSPNTLAFECDSVRNVKSENDSHMHAVTHTWVNNNHIQSNWTLFTDGKPDHTARLDFHRMTK